MSERTLRPSSIELLMHCYYTPADHPEIESACMQSAIVQLMEYELIDSKRLVTPKGQAYCDALMHMPLPEKAWVVPMRGVR